MSTRSAIAVKKADGSVQGIYCHWDGYPAHNGRILQDNYTYDKTLQLVALGNLSFLRKELGEQHPFDRHFEQPELDLYEDWCMFYGRDRGEPQQESHTFKTVGEFVDHYRNSWCEYFYFIDKDGQWWVSDRDNSYDFQPLELAVKRNEMEMQYA